MDDYVLMELLPTLFVMLKYWYASSRESQPFQQELCNNYIISTSLSFSKVVIRVLREYSKW